MKKIICFILVISMMFVIPACSKQEKEKSPDMQPQTTQMRSICELATMKCYYHTVAKYYEKDVEGSLWWKKDRHFWVEYSGIVTLGIDASSLKMQINGNQVIITLPEAEVQDCKVDESSLTKDSFIVDKNSAKVLAEHQTAAFKDAQSKLRESAQKDTALLASAQDRAKELLQNYVNAIGGLMNRNYTVIFIGIGEDIPTQLQSSETTEIV